MSAPQGAQHAVIPASLQYGNLEELELILGQLGR
jgi:hypothetical protein